MYPSENLLLLFRRAGYLNNIAILISTPRLLTASTATYLMPLPTPPPPPQCRKISGWPQCARCNMLIKKSPPFLASRTYRASELLLVGQFRSPIDTMPRGPEQTGQSAGGPCFSAVSCQPSPSLVLPDGDQMADEEEEEERGTADGRPLAVSVLTLEGHRPAGHPVVWYKVISRRLNKSALALRASPYLDI